MSRWDEVRDEFRSLVFRIGVDEAANRIPASRRTIYRMISGETESPCHAIVDGAIRMIEKSHEQEN